jgi:predicted SprT family Zn-dependent metalloprotease
MKLTFKRLEEKMTEKFGSIVHFEVSHLGIYSHSLFFNLSPTLI